MKNKNLVDDLYVASIDNLAMIYNDICEFPMAITTL